MSSSLHFLHPFHCIFIHVPSPYTRNPFALYFTLQKHTPTTILMDFIFHPIREESSIEKPKYFVAIDFPSAHPRPTYNMKSLQRCSWQNCRSFFIFTARSQMKMILMFDSRVGDLKMNPSIGREKIMCGKNY